jgi:hypothetical protein
MSEPKKNQDGEHIEELLSQLKGIFGHLSEADQEEAKQKITPPPARELKESVPEPVRPEPSTPAESEAMPMMPEPPPVPEFSLPEEASAAASEPVTPIDMELPPIETLGDSPQAADPLPSPPIPGDFNPSEITVPQGAALVPTAVFYPVGRIKDAKLVADKVERITPKFTKVSVVINVQALAAFDVKAEVKQVIVAQLKSSPQIKGVLVLIDKPMDDPRRKALVAELEHQGIYFQEIPLHQIEKKALYTDMLLGMVFFFDSQTPKASDA